MRHEVLRKIIHITTSVVLAVLAYESLIGIGIFAIIFILSLAFSLIARACRIPVVYEILDIVDKEVKMPGKGAATFFLGCLLVAVLFQGRPQIIAAAIIILGLGDAFCAIVGKHFGKIKLPHNAKKTLEGSIAGIIAGFIGASYFVPALPAFVASFIAISAESFELKLGEIRIDDNITIPFVAAVVLFFMPA